MPRKAAQTALKIQRSQDQAKLKKVKMVEDELKNVFNFTYLGHSFQADGETEHAIVKRMTQAKARFRQLHEVWRSKTLNKKLKIQLYRSAVISVLVHGHEAWDLTPTMMITLNGWNSRCVALITGREIRQEAGKMGQTFDLVADLRVRRLKWVGHVLRMDDSRYVKQSIKALWKMKKNGKLRREGSVLMDVPK